MNNKFDIDDMYHDQLSGWGWFITLEPEFIINSFFKNEHNTNEIKTGI